MEPALAAIKSYASSRNPLAALRDGMRLLHGARKHRDLMAQETTEGLAVARRMCTEVQRLTGLELAGLRTLEIGAGPLPTQLAYLAVKNDSTGIDLDVYPRGLRPGDYIRMLRRNGPLRCLKTVVRKAIGVDRAFWSEVARQLELKRPPQFKTMYMDAAAMTFRDASFDFVSSYDVFEHLPEPGAVLEEIKRVLRPGGVMYHTYLPFTAENGFHDLRLIAGQHEGIPYWAHLRPECRSQVQSNAYLNGLSLAQWREVFEKHAPGATMIVRRCDDPDGGEPTGPRLVTELRTLREAGELSEYTDDDLMVSRMIAAWRKPE